MSSSSKQNNASEPSQDSEDGEGSWSPPNANEQVHAAMSNLQKPKPEDGMTCDGNSYFMKFFKNLFHLSQEQKEANKST